MPVGSKLINFVTILFHWQWILFHCQPTRLEWSAAASSETLYFHHKTTGVHRWDNIKMNGSSSYTGEKETSYISMLAF